MTKAVFIRKLLKGCYLFINKELETNAEDTRLLYEDIGRTGAKVYILRAFLVNSKKIIHQTISDPLFIDPEQIKDVRRRAQKLNQLFKLLPQNDDTWRKVQSLREKSEQLVIIVEALISFLVVEETILHKSLSGHINEYTLRMQERINRMTRILNVLPKMPESLPMA